MNECWAIDLGLCEYTEASALQRKLVAARKTETVPHILLLCQHPHVITLGRNGKRENLLASEYLLHQMGVKFHLTNRGGDITYHGPGQLVGYPILNLAEIRRDVVWYVRQLEEVLMRASAEFGVVGVRKPGKTGVWVDLASGDTEKLAAIGVHISRWVTSHGFAYNVSTDLRYFDLIVPCGIEGTRPTSLERLLGRAVSITEFVVPALQRFGEVFALRMRPKTLGEIEGLLVTQPDSVATTAA